MRCLIQTLWNPFTLIAPEGFVVDLSPFSPSMYGACWNKALHFVQRWCLYSNFLWSYLSQQFRASSILSPHTSYWRTSPLSDCVQHFFLLAGSNQSENLQFRHFICALLEGQKTITSLCTRSFMFNPYALFNCTFYLQMTSLHSSENTHLCVLF